MGNIKNSLWWCRCKALYLHSVPVGRGGAVCWCTVPSERHTAIYTACHCCHTQVCGAPSGSPAHNHEATCSLWSGRAANRKHLECTLIVMSVINTLWREKTVKRGFKASTCQPSVKRWWWNPAHGYSLFISVYEFSVSLSRVLVSHLKVSVLGVFLSCYILLSIDRLCLVHVLALLPLVILSWFSSAVSSKCVTSLCVFIVAVSFWQIVTLQLWRIKWPELCLTIKVTPWKSA